MEVIPLPSPSDVARLAADIIEDLVGRHPTCVLGVATGSTPLPTYAELASRRLEKGTDYGRISCVLLDEYVGLSVDHPQTYRNTILREFAAGLAIDASRVHGPDPNPATLARAGERYEAIIADLGGVDLQILGIGSDGHLAFNEPGSSLQSLTRVKTLTEQTRMDNARFFRSIDEVPRHVLTQGLGTIQRARHLLLIATGPEKADALSAAVEGPLAASCPASVLQLHPRVTVLADASASSGLSRRGHYVESYALKPAWQKP